MTAVHDLPPGWGTDLAVLELTGSRIEDLGDHLVVRTPANPGFRWGNFLLVTDPGAVGDAERWTSRFADAFPGADHLTVAFVRAPGDARAWQSLGLEVQVDDVLTTRTLPRETPLADGYEVHALAGQDWELSLARALVANAATGQEDAASFERFATERTRVRRALSERGDAAFFGAFSDGALVAELGIVRCGRRARYQDVGTDELHRRRGLASFLLGTAARWAGERGCDEWVIVTEATNPAGRVYRSLGFTPDVGNAHVHRGPAG